MLDSSFDSQSICSIYISKVQIHEKTKTLVLFKKNFRWLYLNLKKYAALINTEIEIILMMKVDNQDKSTGAEVVTKEMGHPVHSFGGVLTDPTKHLVQTHELNPLFQAWSS